MHALWDRILRRDHADDCKLQQLDAKIADLRKQKHDLANRTQVIEFEAYWGRKRREESNAGSSSPNRG